MQKRFQLRQGNKVLATLTESETGDVTLSHDLTEHQLRTLPTVMPFDESGTILKVQHDPHGGKRVSFLDDTGVRLRLGEDEVGFLDVGDTKGLAGLRTKLTGPGSAGCQPVNNGYLVLELAPFPSPNR